jgi:hypothetical protein
VRHNPSTVVVLVGEVSDALLAAVGRSMNVSVIRPPAEAGSKSGPGSKPAAGAGSRSGSRPEDNPAGDPLSRAAEALARAARSGLPYVLVAADPLAAVAAQWRAMWDVSRAAEGTAGFELQAGLALAAWRAGRFELPDYYLEIAPAETGETTETGQGGPDLYLGPLRSARAHRVAVVASPDGPELAARVLQALGSLRPGPWWPPLDDLLDIARHFYPGQLAGTETAAALRA